MAGCLQRHAALRPTGLQLLAQPISHPTRLPCPGVQGSNVTPFDVAEAVNYKPKSENEPVPSVSQLAGKLLAACSEALAAKPAVAAEAISRLVASARKLGPMQGPAL